MESFGFIFLLIFVVLLQAITNYYHGIYYQKKVKKISTKYTEGYLGVGITNKFLRPGKVAIVVTDNEGVIVECNILSGMMVLSKFYKYKEYEGEHIDMIDWNKKKHKKVVEEAINKIIFQKVNKRNSVLNKKLVS